MLTESTIIDDLESRLERAKAQRDTEPMDKEELELVLSSISTTIGKLDRMCNAVLLRPGGLASGAIDSLQLMKVMNAHLRWHIDHPLAEAADGQTSP